MFKLGGTNNGSFLSLALCEHNREQDFVCFVSSVLVFQETQIGHVADVSTIVG